MRKIKKSVKPRKKGRSKGLIYGHLFDHIQSSAWIRTPKDPKTGKSPGTLHSTVILFFWGIYEPLKNTPSPMAVAELFMYQEVAAVLTGTIQKNKTWALKQARKNIIEAISPDFEKGVFRHHKRGLVRLIAVAPLRDPDMKLLIS